MNNSDIFMVTSDWKYGSVVWGNSPQVPVLFSSLMTITEGRSSLCSQQMFNDVILTCSWPRENISMTQGRIVQICFLFLYVTTYKTNREYQPCGGNTRYRPQLFSLVWKYSVNSTFTMLTYGWQEDYESNFSGNIKCQSEMCLADSGAWYSTVPVGTESRQNDHSA